MPRMLVVGGGLVIEGGGSICGAIGQAGRSRPYTGSHRLAAAQSGGCPTPPMNTVPQTLLGRYKLLKVLGRGAMGVVYEATDTRLSRTVAIKTVLRNFIDDESTAADYSARFEREAQAAARLNHPHIVAVFDFGEQDGVSFIVMEFVRGRELGQAFAAGEGFDLQEVVRIMGELLDALAYAHEHGIVHRDVKPANVMIDNAGRVKLTDFGVARVADTNQDRTLPGTMVGTPSYMAPEQILGLAVGSRADIFGAGVVLYQFLTGTRPFVGGGPFGIQRKIVHDEPMPPSQVNPAVPVAFDAVVSRALAKRPEDRYESAAAFAADLRRVLVLALATGPGAAVDIDPDSTVVVPVPTLPPTSSATRPPVAPQANATTPETTAPATASLAAPTSPPAVGAGAKAKPQPAATDSSRRTPTRSLAPNWPVWAGGLAAATAAAAGLWLGVMRPGPQAGAPAVSAAPAASAVSAPVVATTTTRSVAGAPSAVASRPAMAGPNIAAAARVQVSSQDAPVRPVPTRSAPAAVTGTRSAPPDPRCDELLLRIQLGDQLTPEQTTHFHTRCAR